MALNLLTSLTSILGGVVAYFALGSATSLLPYALAFAASSFIYVSVADLIPGLHRRVDFKAGVEQLRVHRPRGRPGLLHPPGDALEPSPGCADLSRKRER